jgi:hypothetical protein
LISNSHSLECYVVFALVWKNIPFISMVYINECTDVNIALKNSFKSMSCKCRLTPWSINFQTFLTLASPMLYLDKFFQIYGVNILNYLLTKYCMFVEKMILYWCYLWNENSSDQNSFIQWYYYKCRIDVIFEMRIVLSRIHLFNDTILNVRHHFILNRNGGEESKIAERPRVRVCERQSMVEGGGSICCKAVCWWKHNGKIRVGLKGVRLHKFQRM